MTENPLNYCLACKSNSKKESHVLSNGNYIHIDCYEKILSKIEDLQTAVSHNNYLVSKIQKQISNSESLWSGFKSFLFKEIIDIDKMQLDISKYDSETNIINSDIEKRKLFFSSIYNYWSSYPPDWHERRQHLFATRGQHCQECNSSYNLHIHHKTPISRGGNHKPDNLIILCENCHSHKHGDKKFTYDSNDTTSVFSSRIEKIQSAIRQDRDISFFYKKPAQRKFHKRSMKPHEIVSIPHVHDNDVTICVKGYCYKRNASRTFAIKRMKALKS